jgi:AcrR family transcriptional regulator
MSEALARRVERRTRQRATNRAAILDAARRVAAREGAGNLSLRAVAAEAGYAPASVYEYFQNRAELVLALASDELAQLARDLRDNRQAAGSMESAGAIVLAALRGSGALPAAKAALTGGLPASEAERLFNGKLIAALTAFAESSGLAPVTDRRRQADVVLATACLVGLSLLGRAGRLSALSQDEQALLTQLSSFFSSGKFG